MTLKAKKMLFEKLRCAQEIDDETFVLVVEAVCALSASVGVNTLGVIDLDENNESTNSACLKGMLCFLCFCRYVYCRRCVITHKD